RATDRVGKGPTSRRNDRYAACPRGIRGVGRPLCGKTSASRSADLCLAPSRCLSPWPPLLPQGFLVFAVLVAVAALRPEGRALGGGLLISFALWWVYFVRGAVDRCDLMNRQPGGSCAIYGTNEQLALGGCVRAEERRVGT